MPYADHTRVPVERTRAELEAVARKYGATMFTSGWTGKQGAIEFSCHGRRVRFTLPTPTMAEAKAADEKAQEHLTNQRKPWTEQRLLQWQMEEERRRWRALLLAVKAKLEMVETGIASFEEEFLAHVVTDNSRTVYERLKETGFKLLAAVDK